MRECMSLFKLPSVGTSGHITMLKGKCPNNMEKVAEFDNIILDKGLYRMGLISFNTNCVYLWVGSGNALEAPSQTGLINPLFYTNAAGNNGDGVSSQANNDDPLNPYVWAQISKRFAPRGSAYNVSEVGFGHDTVNTLFNRALIRNSYGELATISVLGDEYLEVIYQIRIYPPMQDAVFTVIPTGKDTEERQLVVRAGGISTTGVLEAYNTYLGWNASGSFLGVSREWAIRGLKLDAPLPPRFGAWPENSTYLYTNYSDTASEAVSQSNVGFSGTITSKLTLTVGNSPTGVWGGVIYTSAAQYCFKLDKPFMKTAFDELTFRFEHTWGRR